jgi:transposase
MRPQTYRVELTDEERVQLLLLTRQGKAPARAIQRAHILLRADEGAYDHVIAEALHVSRKTVGRVRQRFAEASIEHRLDTVLYDPPRPGAERKLDAKQEAFLIALACSEAPEGRKHWTMQLLADRLIELEIIDSISDETVRRTLKKTYSSPGRRPSGVFRQ